MKYLHIYPYGVIIAFIIDSILGIKEFSIITLVSIFLTLLGVFILADVKLKIKELRRDLLVRIVCEVALGYVAHYMLKYWSNAVYILLLNLSLTVLFSKGYTFKYHKKHKRIIKWVFLQQTFGFFTIYLGNYLSTNSVTLYQYVRPVTIVFTIFVAFMLKNIDRKPKLKDLLAVILVALGVYLINYNI